jgi:hypothetical protein
MARERRSVGAENASATNRAWDWSISFGVNDPCHDNRSYSDHRHMKVQETVILPSRMSGKLRKRS